MADFPKTDDVTIELATVVDEISAVDYEKMDSVEWNNDANSTWNADFDRKSQEDIKTDSTIIDAIAGLTIRKIKKNKLKELSLEDVEKLADVRLYHPKLRSKTSIREEASSVANYDFSEEAPDDTTFDVIPEDQVLPVALTEENTSEENYSEKNSSEEDSSEENEEQSCNISSCCSKLISPCRKTKHTETDEIQETEQNFKQNPDSYVKVANPISESKVPLIDSYSGEATSEEAESSVKSEISNTNTQSSSQDDKGPKKKKSKFLKMFSRDSSKKIN